MPKLFKFIWGWCVHYTCSKKHGKLRSLIHPYYIHLAPTGEKHSTLPLPSIIKSLYHGTFWVDSKFLPLKAAPTPSSSPFLPRCKALLWSGHRASPPSFQIWGHKSQIWGHLSWMRRSRWGRTCSFAPKAGGRQIKSGFTHNFPWCGWHHNIWQGWTGKIGRRKSHRYGCTYTPMVWRMDWDWFEIRITSSRDNIFAQPYEINAFIC